LTGAGWGGCCVSLVRKDILPEFLEKMRTYYTKKREPGQELPHFEDLDQYLFSTTPAKGACVLNPTNYQWN
jgi:galactokinase